ncbi:MAG TPA: NUDIX domain-containing protein [Candidatus Acidoferrales bacterium]|nr:NUDIX domain-containing protein [Candidatus Acidoferrales bacterium]
MLTVVAALIESQGKILACQRRRGAKFELQWEFPGGKVQPGESLESALARELAEELAISAAIGPEIHRARHHYAEMREPIEIVFFHARADVTGLRNCVFERIEWRAPAELPQLDFLPADRELIERLATGAIRLESPAPRA